MGLIQVLIAAAIMSIISLGVATMIVSQNQQAKALYQKAEVLELKNQVQMLMQNPANCDQNLLNQRVNLNGVTPTQSNNSEVNLGTLSIGAPPNSLVLAAQNQSLSTSSTGLRVSRILFREYYATGIPGLYRGVFEIRLHTDTMVVALKPVKVQQFFRINTSDPITNARVTSCAVNPENNMPTRGFCTPPVYWDNSNAVNCPAITGYTTRRITAVRGSPNARGTGCCYIPTSAGSGGWCSGGYEGWFGFTTNGAPGCGPNNANYTVLHLNAITSGNNNTHECCFVPVNPVSTTAGADTFSSITMRATHYWNGCNGPSVNNYRVLETNAVTGGVERQVSCTYISQ